MVYTYNGISFSLRKEVNPEVCHMGKPEGCYAKWNKPVTEWQILYDSAYIKYLNSQIHRSREQGGCQGLGEGANELLLDEYELSVMKNE